ncbi:YqiA/YcfP family alpha/beta fold hydrolase [Mammaliicoccus sciuri]|uniref:YqiA/YcfP family alpha/beta fold hydrolase n=1 Tax=Mammaliicoccus sciuri TaxID=1296 RepID=UPI0018B064E1|nr:YqiA/YcfP family alpha/beta fold hydrolase [Mammaliicoccus sciuri]MBF9296653.1 glycosyl transferase [Staphylococcus schleiferi]MDO0949520.1 YqiA/YcfP family alpha/beta fold hydrolase [Mammaliicoccus sciuri]MDO0954995.1 YqiA/YcfP family alpha/beta fold hydrolase [Mammaliicoccus sciuri]
METLNYEDLNNDLLWAHNHQVVKIMKDDLDIYIKLNLKEDNHKLVVFSNGAIDPSKSKPPVFMRSKWHEDFNANCLYIDDRTVHYKQLRIGWGVGREERHFLKDYSEIAQQVTQALQIESQNVVYCGSSAGGFMSMYLATLHKGSTAVVNNPQCYVDRYDKVNVEKLYTKIFPNRSRDYIKKQYALRLSITSLFRKQKYVPKIYYIQNRLCETDMTRHFDPFCSFLDKYEINSSNIKFILYNNKKLGHNPISREATVNFVNQVLEDKLVIAEF